MASKSTVLGLAEHKCLDESSSIDTEATKQQQHETPSSVSRVVVEEEEMDMEEEEKQALVLEHANVLQLAKEQLLAGQQVLETTPLQQQTEQLQLGEHEQLSSGEREWANATEQLLVRQLAEQQRLADHEATLDADDHLLQLHTPTDEANCGERLIVRDDDGHVDHIHSRCIDKPSVG